MGLPTSVVYTGRSPLWAARAGRLRHLTMFPPCLRVCRHACFCFSFACLLSADSCLVAAVSKFCAAVTFPSFLPVPVLL